MWFEPGLSVSSWIDLRDILLTDPVVKKLGEMAVGMDRGLAPFVLHPAWEDDAAG